MLLVRSLSAQRFDLRFNGATEALVDFALGFGFNPRFSGATEALVDFALGFGFGPRFNGAFEAFFDSPLPRRPLRIPGLIYSEYKPMMVGF